MSDFQATSESDPPQRAATPDLSIDLERALRTPLAFSLGPSDPATTEKIVSAARQQHVLVESLWELFSAKQPPVELLILVRDFAKRHLASHASPFSSEQARLIYLASISAAFVRSGTRISSASDGDMLRQLRWAAKQAQAPAELRSLFQEALAGWGPADSSDPQTPQAAGETK